jgi:Uncharacterized conserved protein (DUF2075)
MTKLPDPSDVAANSTARAWWSGSVSTFLTQDPRQIIDRLAFRAIETHATNRETQLRAWAWELDVLRSAVTGMPGHWRLLLEYPLVRLGRIIDAVLVSDRAIFVFEFKAFNSPLSTDARRQVEDYALDLRDFHAGSRHHVIVPILVAGTGQPNLQQGSFLLPDVSDVYMALPDTLPALLADLLDRIPCGEVNIDSWEHAAYRPVPTIIEAARDLYAKHGVSDIRAARADTVNLSRTTESIQQAIREARATHQHIVLFVTGIPGAGKTLCGLNAIFSNDTDGTFLTGTLPMVYVLKAALAKDAAKSTRTARHETKSKIESITGFLRHYLAEPTHRPEHVIVFDEAQRAWDAQYGATKFKHTDSEAGIVLDIMQRHADHAVIVALVGNGQEINTGEAGLAEWGQALSRRPKWKIRAAPGVLTAPEPRQCLFRSQPDGMVLDPTLHLAVPIRNVRSTRAAPWVDAVLRGKISEARSIAAQDLPFFITRSLPQMRAGLRRLARGERRAGLVCSSGAKRLVADGIWPKFEHLNEDAVANWFLKRWPDVRASDALEVPATEFACQGLELDYVGLCWGGDLVWAGAWMVRRFSGTKWHQSRQQDAQDFQINTYRVLLTRARAETIIWIPEGDAHDATREPQFFDRTAAYLLECGARPLPDIVPQSGPAPEPALLPLPEHHHALDIL